MNIRTLGLIVLLILLLFTAFLIRIQGTPNIPEGQFTGTDPYLYYWQAQIIAEQGQLPERDKHRWLPLVGFCLLSPPTLTFFFSPTLSRGVS